MKAKTILISAFVIHAVMAFGQRPTMELTFTAIDSAAWIQLHSIKVMNRTQGSDTVLVYPDTVLIIDYVGIPESQDASGGFSIQAYPNPVADYTTLGLSIPEKDVVKICVTDLMGRQVIRHQQELLKGIHTFTFTTGSENLYLVTAEWKGYHKTIKIVNLSKTAGKTFSLSYEGFDGIKGQVKVTEAIRLFEYNPGDELLYIGYSSTLQSGILDVPEESKTYTFQYATNIPCPGMPTVEYEGQVYNTIQIFSQCWLKENLNVGVMVNGTQDQTNNHIIEKYCISNLESKCNTYGGLYQWSEGMQYIMKPGARGICPAGWHLPTDEDWKVLEGAVDSQYGIGNPEWDPPDQFRGYDAGENLKATSGWNEGGNGTDLFGFSSYSGGHRNVNSQFYSWGYCGYWWTSTGYGFSDAWVHWHYFDDPGVNLEIDDHKFGFSVRCLMDN